MSSFNAMFLNFIFKCMPKGENINYENERQKEIKYQKKIVSKNISIEKISFNGVKGEIITPKNNKNNKDIIYYIHGGGFTTGSSELHHSFIFYLAKKYGYTIYGVNYRLSPENKWPAHLDDYISFYNGIIKSGINSTNIIVIGESAGGTLTLSSGLRLKDEHIPLPKAICSFSPSTSQIDDFKSHTSNIKTDYMLKDSVTKGLDNVVFKESDLNTAYASLLYGNYKNMPKIFLAVSDTEVLYDDSVTLYDKLKNEKIEAKNVIKHGVPHAYPIFYIVNRI